MTRNTGWIGDKVTPPKIRMPEGTDEWLTIEELSAWIKVPVESLYQWRARKVGPRGARLGKGVRYRRSDVEVWIATRYDDDPS